MFGNRFKYALKDYGKDNMGIQNIFTPLKNIEAITNIQFKDFITPEMKNIGVLFNWEFILNFLEDNLDCNYLNKDVKFTYFYDSTVDARLLKTLVPTIHGIDFYKYRKAFGFEIEFVDITKFTEQNRDIKVIENAMADKHFDIVFSNPPYGDSNDTALDLKIVEAILPYTEDAVIIQPGGWIDADSSVGKAKKWGNAFGKYIKKVIFIDANEAMNIKLKTHGAIVHYTKADHNGIDVIDIINKESYTADTIKDLTKYGAMWNKKVKAFKEYIESRYNDFMPAHAATSATSDFSIRFSLWCGNVGKSDFYSPINITGVKNQFVEKSYVVELYKGHYKYKVISLNSEEERWNFVNYWKSKVTRFILSFYKHNISFLESNVWRAVPWMDFTQEWNDAKLCEEFGIDEELWQYIDKFIPDYYEDYESGF